MHLYFRNENWEELERNDLSNESKYFSLCLDVKEIFHI